MAGSVQSRLRLTRKQILAFRRRVGSLDERMPEGCGLAATGGVGRPAGQHAESRAALAARARRRCPVVDVGGPLARPALGPSVQHLCRPEAGLRAVLAREASRQRQGPPSGRAHGRAVARPSRRQADDRSGGRECTRRRQLDQVRRDDGYGRDPLGGRACADDLDGRRCQGRTGRRLSRARSTLPPRLRPRDRRRVRPLGRNLPRVGGRGIRIARGIAAAGPIAARRRVAARGGRARDARRRDGRRARTPAAERRRLLPARRSRAGASRSARGPAAASLDAPRVAGRAPRRRRDPRNLETGAAHGSDRCLGTSLARGARRGRGRGHPRCRFQPSTGVSRWSGTPSLDAVAGCQMLRSCWRTWSSWSR